MLYMETPRKSLKWWHRIFFGLLDRTLGNAFISFMKITNAKCSSLQFRRNVATGLIILVNPSKVGRPLCSPPASAPVKRRKSNYFVAPAIPLRKSGCALAHFW